MDNEFNKYISQDEDMELSDSVLADNDIPESTPDDFTAQADGEDIEMPAVKENGNVEIVGVRFKKNGKTYHFAPNGMELKIDDRVIVDTARGQEYGYVSVPNREICSSKVISPLRSVIRIAGEHETKIHEENLKKEIEAYNNCIALIDRHHLAMKLIDVEMSFDRSKLLFYFSAEGRVDFRELVKDLASMFHTRIEMRQIGIRDEAKLLGGLGICGRPFCCSSFLTDFAQVSVKMAKEQSLSLNSAKISGSCGRLMCCLHYEYDTYLAEKALTPKVDTRVMTPDGPGVVTDANPLAGIVRVHLDSASDDSEQTVFIREDVVKESEYNGEKLTKTDIPDRSRKNAAENDFIPVVLLSSEQSEEREKTDERGDRQKSDNHPDKQSSEKNNRKGRSEERRGDRRRGNPQKDNLSDAEPVQKSRNTVETAPTVTESDKKNPRGDRRPHRQSDRRQNKRPASSTEITNDTTSSENVPQPSGDSPSPKKKRKPYYRNFRKNKNPGSSNGEGKNQD